jgi:hypothetical protein
LQKTGKGEKRNTYKILVGISEDKIPLLNARVNGKAVLQSIVMHSLPYPCTQIFTLWDSHFSSELDFELNSFQNGNGRGEERNV